MNINFYQNFKKNLKIALPIFFGQVGNILINLTDNIMVGSLGETCLAGVSLASSFFILTMVLGWGVCSSLSPLSTENSIKNNNVKNGIVILYNGLIISFIISIFMYIIIIYSTPLLYHMGQSNIVVNNAIPFLKVMSLSMIPWLLFETLRKFSEGLSLIYPGMITTWLGVICNIILNYILINGKLGFTKLGVLGSAYATLITRMSMFIILYILLYNNKLLFKYFQIFKYKLYFNFSYIKRILTLGLPVGLQMLFEIGSFAFSSFIVGLFGYNHLAAHQIVISVVSTTYMLTLGLSVAATIRISSKYSLKQYIELRKIGWSVIIMSFIFMIFCGILFIILRFKLPAIYINEENVIYIASNLLIVAAFFQISDGVQCVILGLLRGMQDVRLPMWISLFSYWIIGIPFGWFLSIYMDMKSLGIWIGLGFGLTISSILLFIRYNLKSIALIKGNNK